MFPTDTDTNLALPSPRYIKVHAALCRVARLSGAARCRDLLIIEKSKQVEEESDEDEKPKESEGGKQGEEDEEDGTRTRMVRIGKRRTRKQESKGDKQYRQESEEDKKVRKRKGILPSGRD